MKPGDLVRVESCRDIVVWSNSRRPTRVVTGSVGVVLQERRLIGKSKVLFSNAIGWVLDSCLELLCRPDLTVA